MILMCAWIIWLGNKRGMSYWNWLSGYLVISAISLALRFTKAPDVLVYTLILVCLIYIALFTFWPYLVTKEYAEDLEKQAKINVEYENKKAEQFYQSISDWIPVKTYIDGTQLYEMHNDKNTLNEHSIPSFVKTAGITTISVQSDNFEKACELLGVVPLEEENA